MHPTIAPTWKQHLAWERLKDPITEFLLFGGGAGGGKSWLGCEWLLTNCLMFPGTRWFIGRSELKQIRQSTVVTMYKVLRFHGVKPDKLFRYDQRDNCFHFHNGSRIDLLELRYYPSDPLYERFGSLEYTGGWIEEGGEIDEDSYLSVSSRTGRLENDRYGLLGKTLITCNPKKNWLYYDYYIPELEGNLPGNKAIVKALVDDNDRGESGYAKKLETLKGIQYKRLRLGLWEYDDDPAALIEQDAIAKILRRPVLELPEEGKPFRIPKKRLTCDVARYGSDSSVIGLWIDLHCKLHRFHGLSVPQLVEKVKWFQSTHGIKMKDTCIDSDGVGGGAADYLPGCRQFVNNATPYPAPVNPIIDKKTGKAKPEDYRNRKSQTSFRMSEKINSGMVSCEIVNTGGDTTQEHEEKRLRQELEQVKQKNVDAEGKREVVSKEEVKKVLGFSPDYWDTLHMYEQFNLEQTPKVWGF